MPLLEIEGLTKAYISPDGETHKVVDIPRFSLNAGEQVALEGQSGSGKTTFLNLIAGILRADSGRIVLDGVELTALSEGQRDRLRANTIGYVFQTFNLLQGFTALENVALGMAFGRGADYGHARALLERVGLKDRMHYRPRQMSVGQQQRVAVARALASNPKLVLADEPTGNLDYRNAQDALKLIRETCRENKAALLLVSHDREALKLFESVHKLSEINLSARQPVQEEHRAA
jgi:putative ABC transport system ATP-binding protein